MAGASARVTGFIEKGARLFLWEENTEVSLTELREIF